MVKGAAYISTVVMPLLIMLTSLVTLLQMRVVLYIYLSVIQSSLIATLKEIALQELLLMEEQYITITVTHN